MKVTAPYILPIIIGILSVVPYIITSSYPFFWDTIQFAGKQGLFYYSHNFSLLPDKIDSGHLPFLGIYISQIWKLFGKSLFVSHLAMLPFLMTYAYSTFKISRFVSPTLWMIIWALFLFEPCYFAQSTLVSPDLILMAGFSTMIFGMLTESKYPVFVGSMLLVLASTRGTGLVLALGIYWLFINKNSTFKRLLLLSPAAILFCSYQFIHYKSKGWIGYHSNMDWAISFEKVSFLDWLKNLGIIAWRLLDTGRLILIIALILTLNKVRKLYKNELWVMSISMLFLISLVLIALTSPYKYLTGHRYYMPIYFLIILVFSLGLPVFAEVSKQKILTCCVLAGFIIGHFFTYPRGIAMGWDSTLAYLPYQNLRLEVKDYIVKKEIPFEAIGSKFPNISGFRATDLEYENSGFSDIDTSIQSYILYSNVMNDFPDVLYDKLKSGWIEERAWKKGHIEMILFKKPH